MPLQDKVSIVDIKEGSAEHYFSYDVYYYKLVDSRPSGTQWKKEFIGLNEQQCIERMWVWFRVWTNYDELLTHRNEMVRRIGLLCHERL